MSRYTLDLKPQPDGFGYIYGFIFDGRMPVVHINILPPKDEWQGDIIPQKLRDDWTLHLNTGGKEEIWHFSTKRDTYTFLDKIVDDYNLYGLPTAEDIMPVYPETHWVMPWWFVTTILVGIFIAWAAWGDMGK